MTHISQKNPQTLCEHNTFIYLFSGYCYYIFQFDDYTKSLAEKKIFWHLDGNNI